MLNSDFIVTPTWTAQGAWQWTVNIMELWFIFKNFFASSMNIGHGSCYSWEVFDDWSIMQPGWRTAFDIPALTLIYSDIDK